MFHLQHCSLIWSYSKPESILVQVGAKVSCEVNIPWHFSSQIIERPEDADFAFAHGTEAMGRGDANEPVDTSIEEMNRLLQRCADKGNVPLVIANPDVVTVSGSSLVPMPGALARTYVSMGGQVRGSTASDGLRSQSVHILWVHAWLSGCWCWKVERA